MCETDDRRRRKPGRAPTDSWFEDAIPNLAFVLHQQGKLPETEALYREIMEGGSQEWINNLAWRLATSAEAKWRDGANAVMLAQKAVELNRRKEPNYLDTLAAAHAEAGYFEKAISTQKEAIGLLTDEGSKADFVSRLKLYESGEPYRSRN